jgi:hypothetical protein
LARAFGEQARQREVEKCPVNINEHLTNAANPSILLSLRASRTGY